MRSCSLEHNLAEYVSSDDLLLPESLIGRGKIPVQDSRQPNVPGFLFSQLEEQQVLHR